MSESLPQDLSEAMATLELARAAVQHLAAELDTARAESAARSQDYDDALAQLSAVIASRSWRWSQPARAAAERWRHRATHAPTQQTPGTETPHTGFEQRMAAAYAEKQLSFPTATPVAFTHKTWWRRRYDRRALLRLLVDKVAVREWMSQRVDERYLPRLYDVLDSVDALRAERLPTTFAARSSHASGGVLLVRDDKPGELTDSEPWFRVAHRTGDVPWEYLRRRFESVLALDYGNDKLEWAYLGLPRRILVEELLIGPEGGQPDEYVIFTFDGVPRVIAIARRRFDDETVVFRTPAFEPVRSGAAYKRATTALERPPEWEEMLEIASELGRGVDMARIDLYRTRRGVRFGEVTIYPGGGHNTFDPPVDDIVRGAFWKLPDLAPDERAAAV